VNAAKARTLDHFASPRIAAGVSPAGPSPDCLAGLRSDARYERLRRRLEAAGFFAPVTWQPAARAVAFLAVFVAAFGALLRRPAWPIEIGCWLAIGFVLVQGCFLAHEAMHGAVSRRPALTRLVGHLFDTVLVGFSFSYFCRSHELHHFHCNEAAADPDTQSTLFSVFESSAREKRGLGVLMTRWQHVLIPIFFPLWALTMQWDALTYVARNPRRTRWDQLALLLHVGLWFVLPACFVGIGGAVINYLARSAVAGVYLGVVIPVNHLGRRAHGAEAPGFLEHQLSSTRNLGGSPMMDFLFMGLNSHIEHHLFPSVPTGRLRRGRPVTRAFCSEEGLPYHEQSFGAAVSDVAGHLAGVARSLRARQPEREVSEASIRATS